VDPVPDRLLLIKVVELGFEPDTSVSIARKSDH
jgi:hypothetical protein